MLFAVMLPSAINIGGHTPKGEDQANLAQHSKQNERCGIDFVFRESSGIVLFLALYHLSWQSLRPRCSVQSKAHLSKRLLRMT